MKPEGVLWLNDRLWRVIHGAVPIVCIDLVVIYQSSMILLQRKVEPDAGKWWYPGGRLFKGEDIQDAAKRILKAETGLRTAAPLEFIGWDSLVFGTSPWGKGSTHTVGLVHKLDITVEHEGAPTVRIDENHEAWRWWDGAPEPGIGESPLRFGRLALGLESPIRVEGT